VILLALAAGLALERLRARPAALAVAATALALLAAPAHAAVRSDDGHLGQRWRTLPGLWRDPALRDAALVASPQDYRVLVADDPDAGLLPDFAALRGRAFDPDHVDPRIRDFYQRTARYRLAVDARWSPLFLPLGWLLVGTVSRRIAQLNFPLRAREAATGMTSGVLRLCDPATGETGFTGWLRTQPATGHAVYVGLYGIAHPPGEAGPCVRVIFPLPHGSSTVLLRPSVGADGSFRLISDGRRFGEAGYYRIHQGRDGVRRARYVLALKESFRLWAAPDGVVHTDHQVRFFRLPILRLRYALTRIA
jgi:hypothetical protein